ncbi:MULTISPECIES: AAA family ATPase [unclassified Crossiella]|uniref:ATP-dependent nuclease n=1 Tax=unclassified Crossiella TaxID=2620835 RepID=UPI001FFE8D76|nr:MULTISPECIES: AAA family ATPase [unclassified Crossiella]MCK2241899.1 AAA family ATPase [Crossiella sp. S99.2]MCK2255802.1 AAA family ATPase [Crossiella sp. S99.1]
MTGFRSLTEIREVPIGSPTIVAGHNDGGKTAALVALGFLLGEHQMAPADLSYLPDSSEGRCGSVEVTGLFMLDPWEQSQFLLPEWMLMRRVFGTERNGWECLIAVPADEELRNLESLGATELRGLVKKYNLSPEASRKADYLKVLREYAREISDDEDWVTAPAGLSARLPRLLAFDGRAQTPEQAVVAALTTRFDEHTNAPDLLGRVGEIEEEIKQRLRTDSKSLCDHIKLRCPDITDLVVEPEVSFKKGFRNANLRLVRGNRGPVELDRAGQGSTRRISLAIWEWASQLLAEKNPNEATVGDDDEPTPPPVQTIVVYDEPDTHLDYRFQRAVMDLIREQSAIPNVNVVVATHSMNLIDGVDIADVVNLKLVDGHTVVERLGHETHEEIDRFLGKVAESLGIRNSVLLHERLFVAVEGPSEQQAFPLLFRLSEGLTLQAAGIALWACDNNEGALHLAAYLAARGRRVRLVADADSRRNRMFSHSNLTRHFGAQPNDFATFLGEAEGHAEFEAVFDDALWARVANERWPRRARDWTAHDFAVLRSGKFSSDVLEMLRQGSEAGPQGKPDMMCSLALSLRKPEDVPEALRKLFEELRELAAA